MREVKFILPNSSLSHIDAHNWVQQQLVDRFGGYTASAVTGAWKAPTGSIATEQGIVYVVATTQLNRVREIALQAGRMAKQEAVYIVGPDGVAEIVSLVNVGKEIIRGEAKAEPQRPQVGDFWETADGSKVYLTETSLGHMLAEMVVRRSCELHPNGHFIVRSDNGRYASMDDGPHPLDLKRFIGR